LRSNTTLERNQFLQVMRFVAAALVLCTHATFYYHERISSAVVVWTAGAVGVPMFFVISGIVMVVSSRSLGNNAAGAKQFILRRIVRIVPLWWVALTVKVMVALARPDVVNHNFFQIDYAVKSYLFIPYFNELHAVVPLHGVGWTLLHEIFFYLLFSLSMLCGFRPATCASALIVFLWAAGQCFSVDDPFWAVATNAINLQFVLGMAVGWVLTLDPEKRSIRQASVASLCAVVGASIGALWLFDLDFGVPAVLTLAASTLLFSGKAFPPLFAIFERLGDSSYSLYLFHPFVAPASLLAIGRAWPGMHPAWHIGVAVVVTVAVTHLIHLLIEVPVVRWVRSRLPAP
jgi:exopolysaccharide production protein ExoZ